MRENQIDANAKAFTTNGVYYERQTLKRLLRTAFTTNDYARPISTRTKLLGDSSSGVTRLTKPKMRFFGPSAGRSLGRLGSILIRVLVPRDSSAKSANVKPPVSPIASTPTSNSTSTSASRRSAVALPVRSTKVSLPGRPLKQHVR